MTSIEKSVAPPRRWLRFGIKTLLLATVLASVALLLAVLLRGHDARFEQARQHIAERQGTIVVEWERVDEMPGENESEITYGERPVFVLSFAHKKVTDDDLEAIVPALEDPDTRIAQMLDLTDTAVTDKGVRRLQAAVPDCKIRR